MGKEKKRMERYCDTVSYLGYSFPRGEAVELAFRTIQPPLEAGA